MARILIIDDEASVRDALVAVLTRAGHEVASAVDGRRGIDALSSFAVDVVITDINMPEMDGIEVITRLHEVQPDLPVIAISGGGRTDKNFLLDDADALGAVDTLTKPFELVDLVRAVDCGPGGRALPLGKLAVDSGGCFLATRRYLYPPLACVPLG